MEWWLDEASMVPPEVWDEAKRLSEEYPARVVFIGTDKNPRPVKNELWELLPLETRQKLDLIHSLMKWHFDWESNDAHVIRWCTYADLEDVEAWMDHRGIL
jgi:hypothetical protein